jgi:hypothetical protein
MVGIQWEFVCFRLLLLKEPNNQLIRSELLRDETNLLKKYERSIKITSITWEERERERESKSFATLKWVIFQWFIKFKFFFNTTKIFFQVVFQIIWNSKMNNLYMKYQLCDQIFERERNHILFVSCQQRKLNSLQLKRIERGKFLSVKIMHKRMWINWNKQFKLGGLIVIYYVFWSGKKNLWVEKFLLCFWSW